MLLIAKSKIWSSVFWSLRLWNLNIPLSAGGLSTAGVWVSAKQSHKKTFQNCLFFMKAETAIVIGLSELGRSEIQYFSPRSTEKRELVPLFFCKLCLICFFVCSYWIWNLCHASPLHRFCTVKRYGRFSQTYSISLWKVNLKRTKKASQFEAFHPFKIKNQLSTLW